MNVAVICLVVLWGAGILTLLAARKYTPEIMPWYPLYVLAMEVVSTLMILLESGSLKCFEIMLHCKSNIRPCIRYFIQFGIGVTFATRSERAHVNANCSLNILA